MKIAIFTGGISGERPVSISSAKNVQTLLDFAESEVFTLPEDIDKYLAVYKDFDIVIPVIHGKGGEDGSIQGFLETLGIPYIFSGIEAHAIGRDKKRSKQIAELLGYTVSKEIDNKNPSFPLFAKPRFGGSSVSSGLCKSQVDFDVLTKGNTEEFILEEVVRGREFTVGVIEKDGKSIPLPVIEIVTPENTFFDFEHKYNPENLAREICPAEIDAALSNKLQSAALAVHNEVGVKHMSRSDFIVTDSNQVFFLEINTIPGMTNTSLIPKMLRTAGLDLKQLFKEWCENEIKSRH